MITKVHHPPSSSMLGKRDDAAWRELRAVLEPATPTIAL
jgi:hypothetical protein